MYFNQSPRLLYEFPDNVVRSTNNLTACVKVVDKYITDASNLEEYTIADGYTPDLVAYEVYEDPYLHWVIVLTNRLLNIQREWPKSSNHLQAILREKYRTQRTVSGGTVSLSNSEVDEFLEFVGLPVNNYTTTNSSNVALRPHHFVDATGTVYSYDSIIGFTTDAYGRAQTLPTVTPVSYYDYHDAINENARHIKVPSLDTAMQMKRELARVHNG